MKINQTFFLKKIQKISNTVISLFKKKFVYNVNIAKKLSGCSKSRQEIINDVIKNKPSKKFSAYKIKKNTEVGIDIKILKKIVCFLDKLFHSKKLNNMRKRTLLNEAEIWGVDPKNIITQDVEEAYKNSLALGKQFDNKQTAYLLIYPNLYSSSQHAAMFFGEYMDYNDITDIYKYVSWGPDDSGKSCDNLFSDIYDYGLPEVIPLSGLNIGIMKKVWLKLMESDIEYVFTRKNCSSIVNYLIDVGLGVKSELKDIPFLYPPEQLRERGLSLMLNNKAKKEDEKLSVSSENNQNEISKPLNPRRLFIKNHEQLKQEAQEQKQQQVEQPQKNKKKQKKLFKK